MKITEFNKVPSSKTLNESAEKMFGYKLKLDSFTLEQMHDARNKLRTQLSQIENLGNFDAVLENETYNKSKMFLNVLNCAIQERELQENIQISEMEQLVLDKVKEGIIALEDVPVELQEKAKSKAQQKFMGMVYSAKQGEKPASKEVAKAARGMSLKSAKDYAKTKHKGLPAHVDESILREGEENKAVIIMAVRDVIDRITGWLENCNSMKTDAAIELPDNIRDEFGSEMSEKFQSIVSPALETLCTAIEQTREQLSTGIDILTGEADATEQLGSEESMPAEEPSTDEFAASAPAAGGEEAAGRLKRESIGLDESLVKILTSKKKLTKIKA